MSTLLPCTIQSLNSSLPEVTIHDLSYSLPKAFKRRKWQSNTLCLVPFISATVNKELELYKQLCISGFGCFEQSFRSVFARTTASHLSVFYFHNLDSFDSMELEIFDTIRRQFLTLYLGKSRGVPNLVSRRHKN